MRADSAAASGQHAPAAARAPRPARAVVLITTALLAAFLIWATFTRIEEITRGSGRVVPSSRIQLVQTPEAGVVREIAVRIGQRVARGDVLLRLEDTPNQTRANELEAQFRALAAQIARLEAEVGGSAVAFACPADIPQEAEAVCDSEARLLRLRRESLAGRVETMQQRVVQRQQEIAEANAALSRLAQSQELAERELGLIMPMAQRNLVSQTELLRVQRQLVDVRGQLAGTRETLTRLRAGLAEAVVQLGEQDLQFRREAASELTARRAEYTVIAQTRRGAAERVQRTDIRAPLDGIINALPVTTIGAFLNAGERVLEIVPLEDKLLVETRVRPADIAFVTVGQRALVKVTAYDFLQFGGLNGVVETVSADSLSDPNQRETFYVVIVRTDDAALKRNGQTFPIIPGMQTDVDIITGAKTVLDYLMKPISRGLRDSLRER
jgi:adhesin transport system membrane fusion protein